MNKKQLRPLWLRKRLILPVFLIVGLVAAMLVALLRSDESTIVIYNQTGEALPPLLVQACNQSKTFTDLQDQESVRFRLKPRGAPGAIHIEVAANPGWTWDGGSVESHGGYRVSIRILAANQVEVFTDISWWRKTFLAK
jgi:hypothetical protein